jgi:hypothetical protein
MIFLAMPTPTVAWILTRADYVDALAMDLQTIADTEALLTRIVAIGDLRVTTRAFSGSGRVAVVWNREYDTSLGCDSYSLIRLDGAVGPLEHKDLAANALRAQFLGIDHRVRRLDLPENYLVSVDDRGVTFAIGTSHQRATAGRVGIHESSVQLGQSRVRVFVAAGPAVNESDLAGSNQELWKALAANAKRLDAPIAVAEQARQAAPTSERLNPGTLEHLLKVAATAETRRDVVGAEVLRMKRTFSPDDDKHVTYDEWMAADSSLDPEKRRLIESDILDSRPLRIIGAAGSGKSLLMQLLAVRALRLAQERGNNSRVLYIAHSYGMQEQIWERFIDLGADKWLDDTEGWLRGGRTVGQSLLVTTLSELAQDYSGIDRSELLDADAMGTKQAQRSLVKEVLQVALLRARADGTLAECRILGQVKDDSDLIDVLATLVVDEIGIVIKAHNLGGKSEEYVRSANALSRLHGQLNQAERTIIFEVFEEYERQVDFFDADDVALTFLSHLGTPAWRKRRLSRGCDYLFVDEVQLFNENELKILAKLPKSERGNLPIALAIDRAQDLSARVQSGIGKFGIEDVETFVLQDVYRCATPILKLGFYVLQKTVDLFNEEFPDFTAITHSRRKASEKSCKPTWWRARESESPIIDQSVKLAQKLRKANLRRVCLVCFTENWMPALSSLLRDQFKSEFRLIETRGEALSEERPLVVLAQPRLVGGQEFDAVVALGLEEGVTPPAAGGTDFNHALEQHALRAMYLVFTRARHQLHIVTRSGFRLTPVLRDALNEGLLEDGGFLGCEC